MMLRFLVVAAVLLVPSFAFAEETTKVVTVYGRPAKPSVVIEIKRQSPNIGIKPLTPPTTFLGSSQ